MTWREWLHSHPDTLVLSIRRDQFASRFTHRYTYEDARGEELSSDPYLGYLEKVNVYYSEVLRGLPDSTLVIGVRIDGVAKAYPVYRLRGPIWDVLAGHRLRIVPDSAALSAAVLEHGSRLPATPAYWFAWRSFHRKTLIYSGSRP